MSGALAAAPQAGLAGAGPRQSYPQERLAVVSAPQAASMPALLQALSQGSGVIRPAAARPPTNECRFIVPRLSSSARSAAGLARKGWERRQAVRGHTGNARGRLT